MAVPTSLTEVAVVPITQRIDRRWTMAFAAALGETDAQYFDTERSGGVRAHPLFTASVEWPVIVASEEATRGIGPTPEEGRHAVHATHDVTIHRLIEPGDSLTTSIRTVGVVSTSRGALRTLRLETRDRVGHPVMTTWQDSFYLDVPTKGEDRPNQLPPPPLPVVERNEAPELVAKSIAFGDAHVYSECARIWNPIHTDLTVAKQAGLPNVILHGTATMAHAVSAVLRRYASNDPRLVRRVRGDFKAPVMLPDELEIRLWPPTEQRNGSQAVAIEVANSAGALAIANGIIELAEPAPR